ncbi:MAG: DUF805 domain-containing protein [Bacteroidetes bacterium]|nr:DUF805 domain-containing protein [Bacteroidota bacterium]
MFKNPLSAKGRIRRSEYVISFIFVQLASYALGQMFGSMGLTEGSSYGMAWKHIPTILLSIWLLMQGAKRCHDMGNSGWFQIIPFYFVWMAIAPGDEGDNEFGPSPN